MKRWKEKQRCRSSGRWRDRDMGIYLMERQRNVVETERDRETVWTKSRDHDAETIRGTLTDMRDTHKVTRARRSDREL